MLKPPTSYVFTYYFPYIFPFRCPFKVDFEGSQNMTQAITAIAAAGTNRKRRRSGVAAGWWCLNSRYSGMTYAYLK
jgi:hypothetical protein